MRVRGRAATGLVVAAVYAAGLASGFVAGWLFRSPQPNTDEIRQGPIGFINPLLDCEAGHGTRSAELRPFEAELEALIASLRTDRRVTRVSVYFRDLDNGLWVGVGEGDRFRLASLLKVPVVIACLRMAEADPSFLSQKIQYTRMAEERADGFLNPESNLEPGNGYTVEELIGRVGRYSDNVSARLLVDALPRELLDSVYQDLGLGRSETPSLSLKEYGAFFRVLYNASYLSRGMSSFALECFSRSSFELGLVGGVPEGVPVSHKFGVWREEDPASHPSLQLHDCGIVYHAARPYLLCVMTAGEEYEQMSKAIQAVSRFVYETVDRQAGGEAR